MSYSTDPPDELRIDEALAEYMQQCDAGTPPDREDFLARHADIRPHLESLLESIDWMERVAGWRPAEEDLQNTMVPPPAPAVDDRTHRHEVGNEATIALDKSTVAVSGAEDASPAAPPPPMHSTSPTLPCQFGEYRLERILGRGGMGVVYLAYQTHLQRPVALKMIRSGALAGPTEIRRFYSEARAAAQLKHPYIVTVYQCGEIDGHHFFSMDYIEGADLAQKVRHGPLPPHQAARYVRDAARAIAYAHRRGIVHRDLKPANILVDEHDQVHITDFGLAKTIGVDTGLTVSGAAIGTPSFMAPEQAAGSVDEHGVAPDIYSLGAILFALVTGRPPFRSGSAMQTMMQVIHRPAPRASALNSRVDADLDTIIDVCLQKAPERRYPTADALADDLDRYLEGQPILARPTPWYRRAWYWLLGVPILRALLDHRVEQPSQAHRWFQRALIAFLVLPLLLVVTFSATARWTAEAIPHRVVLAGGNPQGAYAPLMESLVQRINAQGRTAARLLTTEGSTENLELLLTERVDLAIVQADAITTPRVAVVAPLFYEAVHLIARTDTDIQAVDQFRGHRVLIGSPKSGSRDVGVNLLRFAGVSPEEVELVSGAWFDPTLETPWDAAIAVHKTGAAPMRALLASGKYRLLPFPAAWQFALQYPAFHPLVLDQQAYPDSAIPATGIPTVATTAFLVARRDTPSRLITHMLTELYHPDVSVPWGIIPPEMSANWQSLPWHPAAHAFLQAYRGGLLSDSQ
ncbi:MAG: protein kinase [Pirellulaceae bacterium]|nr:MAG: protein kinase [Pirellulaceae bacterium]